ncbi:hypothetical protein MPY17_34695 [Rhodococcus opacus]|nr:hypothetical protein MPY17_34695 [Rhodococcus opacus]
MVATASGSNREYVNSLGADEFSTTASSGSRRRRRRCMP